MNYFSLKKEAQMPANFGKNVPQNPVFVPFFNAARNARLESVSVLSTGDAAELENIQYSIRVLLRKAKYPGNKMRN